MTLQQINEFTAGGGRIVPLTVKQYHKMIEDEILEEGAPYELLDGLVVRKDRSAIGADPMTVGHAHVLAVKLLTKLDSKVERMGCHMAIQQPLSLPPIDEPEPDAAIVKGRPTDYRDRHPGARDVTCVIEVAESSLRQDRNTKSRIYASAGIAVYMIVNLVDSTIEQYTHPSPKKGRFEQSIVLRRGDQIEFPCTGSKGLKVPVRSLLP